MVRRFAFILGGALFLLASVAAVFAAGQAQEEAVLPAEVDYEPLPYKETFSFSMLTSRHTQHGENPLLWAELGEVINADIDWTWVGSGYGEKLNTVLASGDLPDIVAMGDSDLFKWIQQGALIELDDLIAKYGANILDVYQPGDMARNVYPLDGKIYGVHGVVELSEAMTHAIRKDWLDELGLPVPETWEEWIDTLRAFKEADPVGGGRTIPWGHRLGAWYYAWGIMGYAADNETVVWTITEDDKYVTRYEHPNYRHLLETLAMMYDEQLIDQEFFVRNKVLGEASELFATGTIGAGQTWANAIKIRNEALVESEPDAYYMPVLPIIGPDGHQWQQGRNRYMASSTITVQAKDPANLMRYIDWCFSYEGTTHWNWGYEGVHHEVVDGERVLLPPWNTGWPKKRSQGLNPTGNFAYRWMKEAYLQTLLQGGPPPSDPVERITYDGLFMNSDYNFVPIRNFDTPTNSAKGADIYPFLRENEIKAIIGEITVDEFFDALAIAKEDGLDTITEEMNEAYSATKR